MTEGPKSSRSRRAPKRTYFGVVFERLLTDRDYSQSSFARECQRRGFRADSQNIIQQSVSNWLTGYRGCPRQIPLYVERILAPTDAEWLEFAVAYTYGQTITPGQWAESTERRVVSGFREFVRGDDSRHSDRHSEKVTRGETEDDGS